MCVNPFLFIRFRRFDEYLTFTLQFYNSVKKNLEYKHKELPGDIHRSRWKVGDWTDDSDQMLLILMSITDNKGKVMHLLYDTV